MTESFKVVNPYNNAVLCEYPFAEEAEIAAVLEKAAAGEKIAADMPAFERSEILLRLSELLLRDQERLARTITRETGKTITDSRTEIDRAALVAKLAGFEATALRGEVIDTDATPPEKNRVAIVAYRPRGAVLCITPFNFPVNLALHKIAPAFAAGNAVIFKPAPQCFLSGKALYDLCLEAGFPPETIGFILPSNENMTRLIAAPEVKCVSFTGGSAVAPIIAKAAGVKKLLFELGGNDALILTPSGDPEKAVRAVVNHRYGHAGQRCTAAKRIFIHRSHYDAFVTRLKEETEKVITGDPERSDVFTGPLVSEAAAKIAEARVKEALSLGATLHAGGERDGAFYPPTLLTDIPDGATLVAEETFAPIACPLIYDTDEELIMRVNASPYGLQCGVFTEDLSQAKRLFHAIEAGSVILNDGPGFRADHLPFGGVKKSGLGREGVRYAIHEMSDVKTLVW